MIFPGFPGVLSFLQVFQVEWEPWWYNYTPEQECIWFWLINSISDYSSIIGCNMYRVTEIKVLRKIWNLADTSVGSAFLVSHRIKKLIRWLASFVIGIQLGFYLFLVPGNMYIRIL